MYIFILIIVGQMCRKSFVQNYILDLKSKNVNLNSIYRIQEQKVSSCILQIICVITTTGTLFRIKNNITSINKQLINNTSVCCFKT